MQLFERIRWSGDVSAVIDGRERVFSVRRVTTEQLEDWIASFFALVTLTPYSTSLVSCCKYCS